ncbi:MAG: mechanosensitive ion channel family protein [Nanoarchaeota archaeon]
MDVWSAVIGYAQNTYIFVTVVLFIFFLISRLIMVLFHVAIHRIDKEHKRLYRRRILESSEGPVLILLFLMAVDIVLQRVFYVDGVFFKVVRSLIVIIFSIVVIEMTQTLLDFWGREMARKRGSPFNQEILPLMHSTSRVIFTIIALLFILNYWGVQVWTLLASVGVVSLILGFALKDSLQNVFGGISMILDKSYRIGDLIQVMMPDSAQTGEVVAINLRTTRIKTFDEQVVIIPNGVLANATIINYALPTTTLRCLIPVGVAYESDPKIVKQALLSTIAGRKDILKFPRSEVRFSEMGDYALKFDLIFYIKDYKHKFRIRGEVMAAIYDELHRRNIQIPFPTRTNYGGNPPKPYKP